MKFMESTKQNIRELQNRSLWFCHPHIQNNAQWPGRKANISESADENKLWYNNYPRAEQNGHLEQI